MKKILLLIPSLAGFGGAERVVASLSKLFVSGGHQVFIATFDAQGVPQKDVHQLGPIPRLPLLFRPISYAIAVWRLNQLKRKLSIDVTISNLWGADLISSLSSGRDQKIALCHINILGNPDNRLMVKLRPLVAAIYRRFDRVIAVSKPLAAELGALYKLSEKHIDCIENFSDTSDVISNLPADGVERAVWCGRMVSVKNVDGLLYAWSQYIENQGTGQLLLLGDGPLRADLEILSLTLGLRLSTDLSDRDAQVVFLGHVSNPESYMRGARLIALTSHSEGIPMVILEALASGLPVLASDCQPGGVRSALKGAGHCDPKRVTIDFTSSGALLPVPSAETAATLSSWAQCFAVAFNDQERWGAWCQGALEQAKSFSSVVVRDKWLDVIHSNERQGTPNE